MLSLQVSFQLYAAIVPVPLGVLIKKLHWMLPQVLMLEFQLVVQRALKVANIAHRAGI